MDKEQQRTLELLTEIEKDAGLTQNDLAVRMGVAVGLTNLLMKRVVKKGYVKISKLRGRKVRYLLTPKGISEKSRLAYEFLRYSFQYYRYMREDFRKSLEPHLQSGKKRVVFYGSGETAELAYLSAKELGFSVVQVIDEEPNGSHVADIKVEDVETLRNDDCDFVLITDAERVKDRCDRLMNMGFSKERVAVVNGV